MEDVMQQQGLVIAGLEHELRLQTERMLLKETLANIEDREVTIMADRELPYRLLKKVMASCTAADYGKISLAVLQKSPDEELMVRVQ
jgi:biopolymer transport protein ExbD